MHDLVPLHYKSSNLPVLRIPSDFSRAWSQRYGQRHQLHRVQEFPAGIQAPKKVRIYWRCDHFVLQWWEPSARQNLSDRVEGDVIDAVGRAREIDRRLCELKHSGKSRSRLRHAELVEKFLLDLEARANASRISPRTVDRYRSALAHYLSFISRAKNVSPYASGVDRSLALAFSGFLSNRPVDAKSGGKGVRAMKPAGARFVWDAARALYQWAADSDRGGLLPEGFRNPFGREESGRPQCAPADPFGEGDITTKMAEHFLSACDDYQFRLFTPMIFYGLRVAEPAFLFFNYLEPRWLRVACNPEIGYLTKGRRDKQLPMLDPIYRLLARSPSASGACGLLYLRRGVVEGREAARLAGQSMDQLAEELNRRIKAEGPDISARQRHLLRDQVLGEAGGMNYDHILREFKSVASRLNWPATATPKDFRHHFATTLAAGGMTEPYRQYLMGHSPSTAAIGVYTHLNRLHESYSATIAKEWEDLLALVGERAGSAASRAIGRGRRSRHGGAT